MYILGIDVGTTGTKTLLVDGEGQIRASSYKSYKIYKKPDFVVEQDARDWWDAVVYTVGQCLSRIGDRKKVKAMVLSTQGGSIVPVDEKGEPLRPAIVWMDKRAQEQMSLVLKLKGDEFFYRKTGWKLTSASCLAKIKWMGERETDIFKRTHKFLTTADYIHYKLTKEAAIDPTNGAMTGLMDMERGLWDNELLDLAGIEAKRLAPVAKAGTVLGKLSGEAQAQMGLGNDVLVIMGGHDQYLTALGVGANQRGSIFLSAGTAWVLLGINDTPHFDPDTFISAGRHITDGLWGMLVSVPVGGGVMEWFKENFSRDGESLRQIDDKARSLMGRNKELFFYPYFSGSAYPHYNGRLKGTFTGIGLNHGRYDLALTLMEGVCFEVNHALKGFKAAGVVSDEIIMTGGGAKSRLWIELTANIAGIPIKVMEETQGASMGAALIGLKALGAFKSYREGFEIIKKDVYRVYPRKDGREFYKQKYNNYLEGYKGIEKLYGRVGNET